MHSERHTHLELSSPRQIPSYAPHLKLRILQLTKFYPPALGGIETATYELTEGLLARGHTTDVLCANTHGVTTREIFHGASVTRAASYAKLLSTSISPALITELARLRTRYDVVHVHLPNPMANLALQIARPTGKVVLHWHSDIINQARAIKLYKPLQDWMLRRADAIVATSPPYVQASPWLQQHEHKVGVVPLGINAKRYNHSAEQVAEARAAIRRVHGERRIVFSVGRMASYKGFNVLIEAASTLGPDVLVIIGGGGELLESHRRQVSDRRLDSRVFFTGRMSDLDVAAHMAEATVFCLPSTNRAEAFGMVLLEAMLAGLPIVATQIAGSGVPWVNIDGETGINVPVHDPEALASALRRLVSDPNLARRMGAAARNRVKATFSSERMVEQTIDVYQRLLRT